MSTTPPPILVHLHIPKNAGTTLSRMLKLRMLLHPPANALHRAAVLGQYQHPTETRLAAIAAMSPRDARRMRFYEEHCGYGVHEHLPRECTYLTMLRDPIDRTLSVYDFLRQEGRIPADQTLEEFLDKPTIRRVWWIDNAQVRYLAGEHGEIIDAPVGECPAGLLKTAKHRLEHDIAWFGLLDRFDESLLMLCRVLGWSNAVAVRSNITKERSSTRATVAPELLDRITSMNALDLELDAFARQLFQQRLDAVPDAAAQLRDLRERSARRRRVLGPVQNFVFGLRDRIAPRKRGGLAETTAPSNEPRAQARDDG
ncbi:MAG: sulfotransferase family 2 domain-containing protein [Planctomycetota bacterium]|nr:MAG: sulfotransferase family 2 domain-containing protein [Planctomycetota bacterium]